MRQVFKVSISSTQTVLIHHQDMVIQNKRKLYSEPPSYRSVSDRAKKNEALLNGQCCFLFVLIFPLRTVTEVTEGVFKGLLNAQMNKSWPWMYPFRFPLWCCRGENLGAPGWSTSAFKTCGFHCSCNRMAAHFLGHSIFPLLREKQDWSAQDMALSSPTLLVHTHRRVKAQGEGWPELIHAWRLLLHPRPVRDSWLVLCALTLHRTRNPSSTEDLHLPKAEIL